MSMRESACDNSKWLRSSMVLPLCNTSPTIHNKPKPTSTPIKGGKWVIVLKAGTATNTPRPKKNMRLRSKADVVGPSWLRSVALGGSTQRPRNIQPQMARGTNKLTSEGTKSDWMMDPAVICPPIQSMVVVTSPIGDHAPPELAAMTMSPANSKRSSRLSSSFFSNDTITMVVVRLSKIALRKKVTPLTSHNKDESWVVLIREVTTSKPLWASTTSTMVMAPIKKNTICAVLTKVSASSWLTAWASVDMTAYSAHINPAPRRAEADLLILMGCSNAIAA